MHIHYCDAKGHDWQCGDDCECICGLSMEGHDHSECPVELRACPEHKPEQDRRTAEAVASGEVSEFTREIKERQAAAPDCACGCADLGPGVSVGFCLWCGHRYAEYNVKIQAEHFAFHCPCAPEQLKQSEREWLAQRTAKCRGRNGSSKHDA